MSRTTEQPAFDVALTEKSWSASSDSTAVHVVDTTTNSFLSQRHAEANLCVLGDNETVKNVFSGVSSPVVRSSSTVQRHSKSPRKGVILPHLRYFAAYIQRNLRLVRVFCGSMTSL